MATDRKPTMSASTPPPEIPPAHVQESIGLVPRRTSNWARPRGDHSTQQDSIDATRRRRSLVERCDPFAARVGLVIAALLGVGDVILGVSQLDPSQTIPPEIGTFAIVVGVVTLVALPFAWRGAAWASWLIVVVRLMSAFGALPAFFTPDVPAGFVAGAATEVVLAVLVSALLLIKPRRST